MTTDGGTNSDVNWDEAREALGRVADIFADNEKPISPEELPRLLQGVENYDTIPPSVRETLENLTPDEQLAVTKMFKNLADNHFYLEGGPGGLRRY